MIPSRATSQRCTCARTNLLRVRGTMGTEWWEVTHYPIFWRSIPPQRLLTKDTALADLKDGSVNVVPIPIIPY